MRMSKQTRYNILAERLQNASKIRNLLNDFEEKYMDNLCPDNEKKTGVFFDFNKAVSELNNIKNSFREYSPIEKQDNDYLWGRYTCLRDKVYDLKKESNKTYEENFLLLSESLKNLEDKYLTDKDTSLKDFWNDYDSVFELFRNLKEIRPEARRELWNKLSEIKTRAKKVKEENHKIWIAEAEKQIKIFEENIKQKKERIENLVMQIEKCHAMISDKEAIKEKETIEGWIAEKEQIICKINISIAKLEKRQQSLKCKLGF